MNYETATRQELIAEIERLNAAGRDAVSEISFPDLPSSILDLLPVPVFQKDLNGFYIHCNTAFEKISGIEKKDLVGRLVADVALPLTSDISAEKDRQILRSGENCSYEARIIDYLGRERPYIIYKAPVRDACGVIAGIIGTGVDITELRETERELGLLRQRIHAVLEASNEAIWAVDSSMRITLCNRAFRRIVDYLYHKIPFPGNTIEDIISPQVYPHDYIHWKTLLERAVREKNFSVDFSYATDDSIVHTVLTCYPVMGDTGIEGYAFYSKDITRVKEAEEREYDASEFNRKILDASTIGVITYDSHGQCISANRAAGDILGVDADMLLKENYHELDSWKESGLYDAVHDALQRKDGGRKTVQLQSASGRRPWLDCRLMPFVSQGERHCLMLITDITENRQMEEDTNRIMHELKYSNTELERFAYVASHDLQEPLRVIASYLQLIDKRYTEKLDEKGRDFILRTVNAAKRMQGMIEDLLSYSRVMTHGGAFEHISLDDALADAQKNLRIAIEQSHADITADSLPVLSADPMQMVRLFQNLLSNAIKFCAGVPPVIRITCEKQGSEWLFAVKDNGIGIQPEFRARIFQIFQRLHTRDQYSGSGIGLAVCQRIVDRHGGSIWVDSLPGEGSVFYFTLPGSGE